MDGKSSSTDATPKIDDALVQISFEEHKKNIDLAAIHLRDARNLLSTETTIEDRRRGYRQGFCDAMALALNRETGAQLGMLRGYYRDDTCGGGEEAYVDLHAVAVVSQTPFVWADVDGFHDNLPTHAECSADPTWRLQIDRVGASDVRHAFSISGVEDDEIDAAMAFARAELGEVLTKIKASYCTTGKVQMIEKKNTLTKSKGATL